MQKHNINDFEQDFDEPSYVNARWFVRGNDGQKKGPYTYQQMINGYKNGQLHNNDYVACTGMKQWVELTKSPLASACNRGNTAEKSKGNGVAIVILIVICIFAFHACSTFKEDFIGSNRNHSTQQIYTQPNQQSYTTTDENNTRTATTNSTTSAISYASNESNENNVTTVGINEEFGNKTIRGMVTAVDLDYKNYNSLATIPEGYKAINIQIRVTNVSDSENYVSVGDFDCYADNVITDSEWLYSDGDYNANIAPSRTAVLEALYFVPSNTQSIELEYNPIGEYAKRIIIKIQ